MLVTPVDRGIAAYSLRGLAPYLSENLQLCVYFNGVSPQQQQPLRHCLKRVGRFVQFKDNFAEISRAEKELRAEVGREYVTDGGFLALREGPYENGSEVWSRELKRFTEFPVVGILDADFEILDGRFLPEMLHAFEANPRLGFYATEATPRMPYFCGYSQQKCFMAARHHTWFCLYRRAALELDSDFSFYEETHEGLPLKFDHSAGLQMRLTRDHQFEGRGLRHNLRWHFIHYQAFSKNRTLSGYKLRFYRWLRVGSHNGFWHVLGNKLLARGVRQLARLAYYGLGLQRFEDERQRFLFQEAHG